MSNGSENQTAEEPEETSTESQDQKAKAEKKEKGKDKDCKGLSKCTNAVKNHTNNNQYEVKVLNGFFPSIGPLHAVFVCLFCPFLAN